MDFDCNTNKVTVKLARVGSGVTVTTLRGPSADSPAGAFDAAGRYAYIGWNRSGGVDVHKFALPSGNVTARYSWSGIGYLEDLDTAGAGTDLYVQVSSGSFADTSTRVLDWYDDQFYELMAQKNQPFMHMSVSASGVVGVATDTAPGRVFIKSWATYPFSQIGVCNGNAPTDFTWLAHRVALAGCQTDIGGRRYQFVDMRNSTPRTAWLGRFWGIQPVGLD